MKRARSACLLSVLLAAGPARADIRVWSERDQQGEDRLIRRSVRDLRSLDFDDTVSSLHADERWLVCSEPVFRGDCRVVEGTVANLRLLGMNNRITSLKPAPPEPPPEPSPAAAKRAAAPSQAVAPAPPRRGPTPVPSGREWWQGDGGAARKGRDVAVIDLFEKARRRGHRLRLDGPLADVTDLGYPVGSLVVRGGSWQVCSLPAFQGECRVVDASTERLADGMVVGSLRPAPN